MHLQGRVFGCSWLDTFCNNFTLVPDRGLVAKEGGGWCLINKDGQLVAPLYGLGVVVRPPPR